VKALAGRERDAGVSVRPNETEYSRWFAVNVERSGAGRQAKRSAGFWRGKSPRDRQEGDRAADSDLFRPGIPT